MRQLTDVERTRAVSMAQQETVSLAQILKVSTSLKSYRIFFRDEKGELQSSFALACSCPYHGLPDSNLIYQALRCLFCEECSFNGHYGSDCHVLFSLCYFQSKQLSHARDMENLRAKAREEALEAAKQLEEVQEKLAFNLLVAGEI